jgi:hypothetical protein
MVTTVMANRPVIIWLKSTAASEAAHSVLFALGCFVLGGIWIGLTVVGAYALFWVSFAIAPGAGSVPVILLSVPAIVGAIALVALLFWGNARASRQASAAALRRPEGMVPEIDQEQGGAETRGSLLAYPGAAAGGPMNMLYTGPRLVATAWSHLRRAVRLSRLDHSACAQILEVMLRRTTRVQLNELFWRTELENPIEPLAQLRDLGGILILRRRPGGVILRQEWRAALESLTQPVEPYHPGPAAIDKPGPDTVGAAAVLGLPRTASFEEVESGYRRRLRVVVPRKVPDPELRELAEEQLGAIRSAYEAFLAQHKPDPEETPSRSVEKVWESHRHGSGGRPDQA